LEVDEVSWREMFVKWVKGCGGRERRKLVMNFLEVKENEGIHVVFG
jgi:hypothetical protein